MAIRWYSLTVTLGRKDSFDFRESRHSGMPGVENVGWPVRPNCESSSCSRERWLSGVLLTFITPISSTSEWPHLSDSASSRRFPFCCHSQELETGLPVTAMADFSTPKQRWEGPLPNWNCRLIEQPAAAQLANFTLQRPIFLMPPRTAEVQRSMA